MSMYPINLKAEDIHALVIGAGQVGMRKIDTLLLQEVRNITVVDKAFSVDFKYSNQAEILCIEEEYSAEILNGYNLVFAASNDALLNSQIVQDCKKRNILCNAVTKPEEGSFTLPALVRKSNLLLTISTNKVSPALSRALKNDIENFLDLGYAPLCDFLGKLRPVILALNLPTEQNTDIFRFFVTSPQKEKFLNYFNLKNTSLDEIKKILSLSFDQAIQNVILSTLEEMPC